MCSLSLRLDLYVCDCILGNMPFEGLDWFSSLFLKNQVYVEGFSLKKFVLVKRVCVSQVSCPTCSHAGENIELKQDEMRLVQSAEEAELFRKSEIA